MRRRQRTCCAEPQRSPPGEDHHVPAELVLPPLRSPACQALPPTAPCWDECALRREFLSARGAVAEAVPGPRRTRSARLKLRKLGARAAAWHSISVSDERRAGSCSRASVTILTSPAPAAGRGYGRFQEPDTLKDGGPRRSRGP